MIGLWLLVCGNAALCQSVAPAREVSNADRVAQSGSLTASQVVARLEQKNAQRAAALEQFNSTRIYHMQYRGFPGDRDAEMVVKVAYNAPNKKEFKVVSQSGAKFVIDHVFKRLLEGEQEAADDDNRKQSALTSANYDFTLAGYEASPEGPEYVLNIWPKTKNKFLYRGKIWVDAKDFAVVRIEGEPARNPSMWIKATKIDHHYMKVNDFWLPSENHSESLIRLGGRAILSIEYTDYRITKAMPLQGQGTVHARLDPK